MADKPSHDAEIAWAAGIFEGEGCISDGSKRGRRIVLKISMTDRDVIERIASILGVGHVNGPLFDSSQPNAKPRHNWVVTKYDDSRAVLDSFAPWLMSRRSARAAEVIAIVDADHLTRRKMGNDIACCRGHLRTDHSYIGPRGRDVCRLCQAMWNKKSNTVRVAQRRAKRQAASALLRSQPLPKIAGQPERANHINSQIVR